VGRPFDSPWSNYVETNYRVELLQMMIAHELASLVKLLTYI
jgi:hypothetical protein